MEWRFDNSIPIYTQVIDYIKTDIAKGVYAPGSMLPDAREIAIHSKVNPNAIARALKQLAEENVLYLGADNNYYISEQVKSDSEVKNLLINKKLKEFVDGMRELGISDAEMAAYVNNYVAG